MLVIPLTNNISKKNPPLITVSIIIINCLVFFTLQSGDTKKYLEAMKYYLDSGLGSIEVSRYLSYLEMTGNDAVVAQKINKKKLTEDNIIRYYSQMMKDYSFMHKLLTDEIITIDDEIYVEWLSLRDQFDEMLSRVMSMRYGFIPAFPRLSSAITWKHHASGR